MILRVGLTGGIASGKSTVAAILEELGCHCVDADRIVDQLYQPGAAGHRRLVEEYGPEILTPSAQIDRPRLSRLALGSEEGAARLNSLIHPLVIEEEERLLHELESSGEDRIAVVEATLLLEAGGRDRYDRIVVVEVDPQIQMERALQRGLSRMEVARRIARQMKPDQRRKLSDYQISNNGARDELRQRTILVHQALLRDLEARKRGAGER